MLRTTNRSGSFALLISVFMLMAWDVNQLSLAEGPDLIFHDRFEYEPAPDIMVEDAFASPTMVEIGEEVSVTAVLHNEGDADGEETVSLEVDGAAKESTTVTVEAPGEGESPPDTAVEVTFGWSSDTSGEFDLSVNGVPAGVVEFVHECELDDGDPCTTFADVHPIFNEKCGSCHTGDGMGGHDIGHPEIDQAYNDSQLEASSPSSPSGETIGAAALARIQNGTMPFGAGCSGDPADDAGNSACLSQEQQDRIQEWLDDGQLF